MTRIVANEGEQLGEDYRGWPLRQRLELLAFDARLSGVPQALLEALWEVIDRLPYAEMPLTEVITCGCRMRNRGRSRAPPDLELADVPGTFPDIPQSRTGLRPARNRSSLYLSASAPARDIAIQATPTLQER
jgi:hypothetical protein